MVCYQKLKNFIDLFMKQNCILHFITFLNLCSVRCIPFKPWGGGDSHMKQTGMLVVSLRGINFGFWSRLGPSGQNANI